MTGTTDVLLVTVGRDDYLYEEGLEAIRSLEAGETIEGPDVVTFPDETSLAETFNERTYTLLRVIRDEEPESIRETARTVGRDVKNVHEELTRLEALGVVRFEEVGQAKRPVFPYDDLLVRPFSRASNDTAATA